MKIFALGDPHLSLGMEGKDMDKFGEQWLNHPDKIKAACDAAVSEEDLLLIPGDLSWGLRMEAAQPDLDFLGSLPGEKVIIRGNHDYWWSGIGKVRAALPDRMHALQADAIDINGIHLCGTRLWDVPDKKFGHLIDWKDHDTGAAISAPARSEEEIAQSLKIYRREVGRVDLALQAMAKLPGEARLKIVMIHYPPTDAELTENELTQRFETAGIDHVIFGHLHSVKRNLDPAPFGERNGVHYHLTACDYLDFEPKEIV